MKEHKWQGHSHSTSHLIAGNAKWSLILSHGKQSTAGLIAEAIRSTVIWKNVRWQRPCAGCKGERVLVGVIVE
jgi:hypothetical protein